MYHLQYEGLLKIVALKKTGILKLFYKLFCGKS